MNNKLFPVVAGILTAFSLTACGTDPELTQFKENMDEFCAKVSEINESINEIDAQADDASALALEYLDQLDQEFQVFAEMDFPEEYDYLESLADEASEYMTTAVESYHTAYADDGYDESTADYARENSARAFKRVRVILDILHGEDPTDDEEASSSETVSDES